MENYLRAKLLHNKEFLLLFPSVFLAKKKERKTLRFVKQFSHFKKVIEIPHAAFSLKFTISSAAKVKLRNFRAKKTPQLKTLCSKTLGI